MNIFTLSDDTKQAAIWHIDKHCVKMIAESCQILSTAHRYLDGHETIILNSNNRKIKHYKLNDDREFNLPKATHINHPCCIWTRETEGNYQWLYSLFCELCKEYTYRYGKIHAYETKCLSLLRNSPYNIKNGNRTNFVQAMPEKYKNTDAITAYRQYYINEKSAFASWKSREKPFWFI